MIPVRRLLATMTLVALAAACGGEPAATTAAAPAHAAAWQETVDRFRALQRSQDLPDHLLEPGAALDGTEFDVERYFSILDRIDAEPGFVLDYVYDLTADRGFPVLYVRREDMAGYAGYDQYLAGTGSGPMGQGDTGYLDQIYVVDGTPEGFFQYVVLRLMGGQFYLHWHAQEDDALVVATRERLEEALATVAGEMAEAEMAKARAVDPTPSVAFGAGNAVVEVFVFTRWGGLLRHTYTVERVFPQQILDVEVETVAECDCGITF